MKVIALEAENVKRLRAVSIGFDGTLQVIGGDNGEGKSSVLDAIWLALGGRQAVNETQTTRPIHDGEHMATATVNLGELIVTRTWKEGKAPTVKVTTPEGAEHKSPQAILDALTAKVGMDPLAFTLLSAKDQMKQLLELVELPFDPAKLDADYAEAFTERTAVNKQTKNIEARLTGYPQPAADLPAEEISLNELLSDYRDSEKQNREIQHAEQEVARWTEQVARLERELVSAKGMLSDATAEAANAPAPVDLEAIQARMDSVEETNRAVRREIERQAGLKALAATKANADSLTAKLDKITATRAAGLAKAKWPIDHLGFDSEGLTYKGVPFKQASSAEQIRVSMAMAMAMAASPKLKTLFIRDGSLLDGKNMALVAELAAANGFQIIMERVGDHDKGAVIIEDGTVKAAS